MKKKKLIIITSILVIIILAGLITSYIDGGRVSAGHEPKYTIKITSKDGRKVTYFGLGYKVVRYISVSPNEPYKIIEVLNGELVYEIWNNRFNK